MAPKAIRRVKLHTIDIDQRKLKPSREALDSYYSHIDANMSTPRFSTNKRFLKSILSRAFPKQLAHIQAWGNEIDFWNVVIVGAPVTFATLHFQDHGAATPTSIFGGSFLCAKHTSDLTNQHPMGGFPLIECLIVSPKINQCLKTILF